MERRGFLAAISAGALALVGLRPKEEEAAPTVRALDVKYKAERTYGDHENARWVGMHHVVPSSLVYVVTKITATSITVECVSRSHAADRMAQFWETLPTIEAPWLGVLRVGQYIVMHPETNVLTIMPDGWGWVDGERIEGAYWEEPIIGAHQTPDVFVIGRRVERLTFDRRTGDIATMVVETYDPGADRVSRLAYRAPFTVVRG